MNTQAAAARPSASFNCRFCGTALEHLMIDLGLSPLCEDFIKEGERDQPEQFYPLQVFVCDNCWLAQAKEFSSNADIFDDDYGYFSSYSSSWLRHAERYVNMMTERYNLNQNSFVVEIASNDGYLLRNFVEKGIPCLGVDPAANVAKAAEEVGVQTCVEFFTDKLAKDLVDSRTHADLVLGNNVLAHTPYINDFAQAVSTLLSPSGVATFEFPHIKCLLEENQFDTIYHEHYSYFSLYTVSRIFEAVGMHIVDVELLKTAGGSLRVFIEHIDKGTTPSTNVKEVFDDEEKAGLRNTQTYLEFSAKAAQVKNELLKLLIQIKQEGKTVVGYGAPGKGNTLLNYCGIKTDLLPFTCDKSTHKHNRYCPGSRIPIYPPDKIDEVKPDYILILPWNLQREIVEQLKHVRDWGGKFIIPIPTTTVID